MGEQYYVYLLASARNGTLYVGVTNNLMRRVAEHKEKLVPGFTRTHGVDRLMWFEVHGNIEAAITREKQIKTWKRAWKLKLFSELNPMWDDLYPQLGKGIW